MKVAPILNVYVTLVVFLALAGFFIILETRKQSRFKAARVVAIILLMLALSALFFRPSFTVNRKDLILIINGQVEKKFQDSVQIAEKPSTTVAMPGAGQDANTQTLKSINELSRFSHSSVIIAGQGLNASARSLVRNRNMRFIPRQKITGIISLHLKRPCFENQMCNVSGTSAESGVVYLKNESGVEDSATITRDNRNFTLTFVPKTRGKISYTISLKSETGKIAGHELPLWVDPPTPLRILVLQRYPTFEIQYLKQYLAQDHQIVFRYQLSKNIYKNEFLNHPAIEMRKISGSILSKFDLLIVDPATLLQLSFNEQEDIRKSVQDGLGILLQAEEPIAVSKKGFLQFLQQQKNDTIVFGNKTVRMLRAGFTPKPDPEWVTAFAQNDNILSCYRQYGKGKIGFQFLQDTYKLALSGDSTGYATVWLPVIQNSARANRSSFGISIRNPFPNVIDEPLAVRVIGAGTFNLLHDGIPTPLLQDENNLEVWTGEVRCTTRGWHKLQIAGDSTTLHYFAFGKDDWKDMQAYNDLIETKKLSENFQATNEEHQHEEPVNPLIFFLVVLLSAGFLWLAPKL